MIECMRTVARKPEFGRWIPVSERLPDPETEVLITARRKYKSGRWVDIDGEYDEENDCYIVPEGWWENRHFNPDEVYNNLVDDEVIAWMPLPEPYRESEEK